MHFSCTVLLEDSEDTMADLERRLEPFQANNMGATKPRYLEFMDMTEEVKEEWNQPVYVVEKDEEVLEVRTQQLSRPDLDEYLVDPSALQIRTGKRSEFYDSLADLAEEYFGYEERDGRFGMVVNPNARYDSWSVGGRYREYWPAKKDDYVGIVGANNPLSQPIMSATGVSGYDIIPREDIDMTGLLAEKTEKVKTIADIAESALDRFDNIEESLLNNPFYDDHPVVNDFATEVDEAVYDGRIIISPEAGDSLRQFAVLGHKEFVSAKSRAMITPHAIVDTSGSWVEEEIGLDPVPTLRHRSEMADRLLQASGDTIFANVDCHI